MCFTLQKQTPRGEIFGHSPEPQSVEPRFADHPRIFCSELHFRLRFLLHRGRASLLMRQPLQICLPVHVFLIFGAKSGWDPFYFGKYNSQIYQMLCYSAGKLSYVQCHPVPFFFSTFENYFTKCFLSVLPDDDSNFLSIAGCQRFQLIWVCFKIWRPLKNPSNIFQHGSFEFKKKLNSVWIRLAIVGVESLILFQSVLLNISKRHWQKSP